MTTTLEDHAQLIATARHYVRRPDLTDVPTWADLPKPLAAAVKARSTALKAWDPKRAALSESLRALEGADVADANAIRDAARAGKPLPKAVSRDELARAVEYHLERTKVAHHALDASNTAVKAAMDEHGRALVPQAIARARGALAEHAEKMSQAHEMLTEAADAFRPAAAVLADIRSIVAADMSYDAPNGIPDHRLVEDKQSAPNIHDLLRVLEARGWGEGGTRTKAPRSPELAQ
jgi:hypothetical protein